MDTSLVNGLRRNLSIHFAVLAWLTAMLVATGSGSIALPVFIFFVSSAAVVFVDTLHWFHVGRISSYLGMTVALIVSIASYVYNALYSTTQSGELLAVAGLLIYPEAVLFLQKKTLRVFEQLAVFLLLEMIVAALVNDNFLFGLMLAPIVMLWVSALFLFSRYSTLVALDPTIEQPILPLAELIFRKVMKVVIRPSEGPSLVSTKLRCDAEVIRGRSPRRLLHSLPIGGGAIIFAAAFFYLLPRTSPVGFQPIHSAQPRVGLPKSLRMGQIGRILQDRTPVMRVTLRNATTREIYKLEEPPYLRARVFDTYGTATNSPWVVQSEWGAGGSPRLRSLPAYDRVVSLSQGRDTVAAEFDINRSFARVLYALPPMFRVERHSDIDLQFDPYTMIFSELSSEDLPVGKSLIYEVGSLNFVNGQQIPVTPTQIRSERRFEEYTDADVETLLTGTNYFPSIRDYLREKLRDNQINTDNWIRTAQFLESHLSQNGEFQYSLNLGPPIDNDLDPVEDFVINQKRGHCQYFSAAMMIMLRQCGIPSRIVVGYRPTEFNTMGEYFPVRQSDAHAWVEVLCTREQLLNTEYQQWLNNSRFYWVRFDPTPGSNENAQIVEQNGQAIDFAEKLWKDYVIDGQKLAGENSLYQPVAENSKEAYADFIKNLVALKDNLKSGNLLSGAGGQVSLTWPIAVLILLLVALVFFVWRLALLLPHIAPRLAFRLGLVRQHADFRQRFYARCIRMLEQHGLKRAENMTPREFTQSAAAALKKQNPSLTAIELEAKLDLLTKIYYRVRFGKDEVLSNIENQAIEQALTQLQIALR
ncbi:MAG: DUF3488 domain-containing protein [Planctomycetales bacterium]|nr:DUF3488 domain-containing protein [Planctomycetales bacterium]